VNWLDIVILICLAIGLIKGLFDGFIKQLAGFIALVVAIFFAGKIAILMRAFLVSHITGSASISPPVLSGICYILAFVLIILIITFLGQLMSFAIKKTPAKPLNMLLGGLFGLFIWLLSVSLFLNLVASLDYESNLISKKTQQQSAYYARVKNVVPTVYPLLKDYFKK
jgi:membrane protein required for colicin V production